MEFECRARGIAEARQKFYAAVTAFIDHAAYATHSPVFIASLRIEDMKNSITTLVYTSPFRKQMLGSADLLFLEMAPIYALYREALNSQSDPYKFLCYYKILEGLLGSLRKNLVKEIKSRNLQIQLPRQLVPNAPDLPPEIACYVGKAVQRFFDKLLTPRFRNAVAHFNTAQGGVLHVSAPDQIDEYAKIILLCELCVRKVVSDHEALLRAVHV